MKNFFKYTLSAVALCALASCSDEVTSEPTPVAPENGKELISFDGEGNGITRAVVPTGFASPTKVEMRLIAEEIVASTPDPLPARYANATATASANITSDSHSTLFGQHSDLSYDSGYERYWDDAFGRNTKLSVYAFAIPDQTEAALPLLSTSDWSQVDPTNNKNWYKGTNYTTVTWEVGTVVSDNIQQTSTTMAAKDLTYSNNISSTGIGGRYTHNYDPAYSNETYPKTLLDATAKGDGQMRWWPKTIKNATEKTNNTFEATTGKFDQGHLVFKHSLSYIQINLKEGAGFDNAHTTDFGWTKDQASADQNITLTSFYTSGTFDVSTGSWSSTSLTSKDIVLMNETDATTTETGKTTRHLHAYVVPGNNLYTTTTNVIAFEIDKAQYYVTGKQIADAIREYYKEGGAHANEDYADEYRTFTETKAGKKYVINLTVAKKGIERITAAIIDWETVNSSDAVAKNTYPSFTFEDRGSRLEDETGGYQFNIYRSAQTADSYILDNDDQKWDWETGYTADGAADKTWQSTPKEWKTNWYWKDNLTYYHFRAAGISGHTSSEPIMTISTDGTVSPNLDYFAISSGTIGGGTYQDYIWGAPFKDIAAAPTGKLTYSSASGFDNTTTTGEGASAVTTHQISYAIGSTESLIQMLLFHMTSQISVNIQTTTDASKVTLDSDGSTSTDADKTKVEILNFLPDGRVLMGNGLVTAIGTRGDATMTYGTYTAQSGTGADGDPLVAAKVTGYSYGIVPQLLTWSGGTIGLRITTPDDNQYVIRDLSTCTGTVSNTNVTVQYKAVSGGYTIDRWYPSHQYTYTITIKKTGIERITAAVVPWETVTAEITTPITLEN